MGLYMNLICLECGRKYPDGFRLKCSCGGVLGIKNEYDVGFEDILDPSRSDSRRYTGFVPVEENYLPDLVPPMTPTVEKNISGIEIIFKMEYLMPSGSFKDRGTYVTLGKLKEEGIKEVSLDSSGNAAISLALYGRSEGIKTHIFVSDNVEKGKKRILRQLTSEIHEISGTRMDVHDEALKFEDTQYISHWYNPFFLEGTKISAYEVGEERDINRVLVPTGSGTLFMGLYKGFSELSKFGVVEKIPEMIAVEAKGYESLKSKSEEKSEMSSGVEIVEPPRTDQMREILKTTGGFSVSADDDAIESAKEELLSMGFLIESTSAMAYAAFLKLLEKGEFSEGERVLIPLTGSGLKSM